MRGSLWMGRGMTTVKVGKQIVAECRFFWDDYHGRYQLNSLKTHRDWRNEGHGTRLMKKCIRIAKKQNKQIYLFVGPFDYDWDTGKWLGMNKEQLFAWYGKFGFVPETSRCLSGMLYTPPNYQQKRMAA